MRAVRYASGCLLPAESRCTSPWELGRPAMRPRAQPPDLRAHTYRRTLRFRNLRVDPDGSRPVDAKQAARPDVNAAPSRTPSSVTTPSMRCTSVVVRARLARAVSSSPNRSPPARRGRADAGGPPRGSPCARSELASSSARYSCCASSHCGADDFRKRLPATHALERRFDEQPRDDSRPARACTSSSSRSSNATLPTACQACCERRPSRPCRAGCRGSAA